MCHAMMRSINRTTYSLSLIDPTHYNIQMQPARVILHIDMDAFYASVEQLDFPNLKGKPVLVGGSPQQRGVVAACSYEARKFNVRSAMPMSQAIKLCPSAIMQPVRMDRYIEISRQIHNIFHQYTPDVEKLSIDEAFLDVTGCQKLFGNAESIGKQIKSDIKNTVGLTASVGIAPNKFLAKLASDLDKPDGFVVITEDNKQKILDPLPVSKIWGIGKVTNDALNRLGIQTVEQLRTTPPNTLALVFKNRVDKILKLAHGIDNRPVETYSEAKSFSAEETFAADIMDKDTLLSILHNQVEEVSQRLRAEKLQARTVTLKLRYSDFKTITRSSTLESPTNVTQLFLLEAKTLFSNWYTKSAAPLRLIGFGASGISPQGSGQMMLFNDPEQEKQKKVDNILDKIKEKFGTDSLKRGDF